MPGKLRLELLEGTAKPVHSDSYRAGPKKTECEKIDLEKMLVQNVVELAQTEYPLPIVFVPMKSGTLHFCVDYGWLQPLTERDLYEIPRMD